MKRYIQYKDKTDKTQVMTYDTADVPDYDGPHDEVFDLINLIERG